MLQLASVGLSIVAAAAAAPTIDVGQANGGIHVISGVFGTLGGKRKLDIATQLQLLCGTGGDRCTVFCSETSFGRYRVGLRPICRVTYRCPDATTRSVEAAREEPIVLSCRDIDDGSATEAAPAADQPQPPPYVPPPSG